MPIGSVGELVVGGGALTHGYTAGAAAPDHDRFTRVEGAAMFRTGDLARWTSKGELEYLGRRDRQVKIRGIRIEPAEIEHVLSQHVNIIDNAVVTREHPTRGTELVAYLVVDDPTVSTDTIRQHLHTHLPHHHIPNQLIVIDHLPRLPNGKLDHTTLTTTNPHTPPAGGFEEPAGDDERIVADVFAEITAAVRVGRHDDFFADLGGHSLLAARALSRLRQRLNRDLTLLLLFERPTVAGFAAAARLRPGRTRPPWHRSRAPTGIASG